MIFIRVYGIYKNLYTVLKVGREEMDKGSEI